MRLARRSVLLSHDHETSTNLFTTTDQKTILIVEDDELQCELLAILIEQLGFTVLTAENGDRALDLFACAKQHFHAILLDGTLGAQDGWEVARRIRTQPKGAEARIIAITGMCDAESRRCWESHGVTQILAKPASLEKLTTLLCNSGAEL